MIAIDTCVLVSFYNGEKVPAVMEKTIDDGVGILPCVVRSEILSTPKLPKEIRDNVKAFPVLYPQNEEFWDRVADLRKKLLTKNKKARLADCMIAQLCMDWNVPLITQDKDFLGIKNYSKLKLL